MILYSINTDTLYDYIKKNPEFSTRFKIRVSRSMRGATGKLEGMKEFPCIEYKGTRQEAITRAISDNKSNEWTDWAEENEK